MKTIIVFSALIFSLMGLFIGAEAALVSYSYNGNVFNTFSPTSSYTNTDRVTGSFTVDESLLTSGSHISLPLADYKNAASLISFSDGVQVQSVPWELRFSTDSTGNISQWRIQLGPTINNAPYISTSWLSSTGSNVGRLINTDWASVNNGLYGQGTWTKTVVPIPSAVWLLGAGLVGLVGIRRKFKN